MIMSPLNLLGEISGCVLCSALLCPNKKKRLIKKQTYQTENGQQKIF